MTSGFVHLHLHTDYSLIDGTCRVKPLVRAVADGGMPAVAVTDHCNLFALVKFYQAAQAAGIKPLVGTDVLVRDRHEPSVLDRLVLLCQSQAGYHNLCRLLSRAYLEGYERGSPVLEPAWVAEAADGLIALSGGPHGEVGRALLAGRDDQARASLEHWMSVFRDRFYLELWRTARDGDDHHLDAALDVAARVDCPAVATNDVRFIERDDFYAHEGRVCIHDGRTLEDPRRPRRYSEEQYLKTPVEMAELFADVPGALENSVEIAKRCNLELRLGEVSLPAFPVPEGDSVGSYLERVSREGLEQRLERHGLAPDSTREDYASRLAHELRVIRDMDFPGYFLIVADFIDWAKRNHIPVGPGRGSGAGSLVAYALGITDLDPLRYDLLFERFLNPERVSMPDFDVDFCMEQRDRVIDYVADAYGRDRVCQIITYGSMAAKAAVRDTGRILGHAYGFVDRIAKQIPNDLGITLDKALAESEELRQSYDEDEEVRAILDLARRLEGLTRNAGKHAGGVVIAPSPLTDFAPLYCEEGGDGVVTQFDKDDVEAVGLVKFDFLGLRTLTIIDWALKSVNREAAERGQPALDIGAIPMDDSASFELLQSCRTTAVFQLESRGMKDLIRKLRPDDFEEIIALVALYRPGPIESGMVGDFIDRKHGRASVRYPHPDLESILKPTYGVILYQEQVMQIAQTLAGYSLGEADLLRRAMGKKKPEEMAKQRERFVEGARERGVDATQAESIFDLMEKFAGYGFNKSHSAAYALLAYHTAYLKTHYPAAFMAAVLSSDMDNTDKVVNFIDEARSLGLEIQPPDVNRSGYRFTPQGEQAIVYGLGAIKGVGRNAIEAIVGERERGGAFADVMDLCRRVDLQKVNRRVLESLIRAGALDALGPNRATLDVQLPDVLRAAEQDSRARSAGQADLFGAPAAAAEPVLPPPEPAWPEDQRLSGERDTLGLYLTGHPIDRYLDELRSMTTCRIGELGERFGEALTSDDRRQGGGVKVVIAGLVVAVRRRGGRMAFATLDDSTGRLEVALYDEAYRRYNDALLKDQIVVVDGTASLDDYSGGYRLAARGVSSLDEAKARYARGIEIELRPNGAPDPDTAVSELRAALAPYRDNGAVPVWIDYTATGAVARLELGESWRVQANSELEQALAAVPGVDGVRIVYH